MFGRIVTGGKNKPKRVWINKSHGRFCVNVSFPERKGKSMKRGTPLLDSGRRFYGCFKKKADAEKRVTEFEAGKRKFGKRKK
jgi:hypothetical protein